MHTSSQDVFKSMFKAEQTVLGPVHMVSLGKVSRQVSKNMSQFHMRDVIWPSEMKSARRELAPNQNTAFHPGNQAGVFIWRIFIPPTYDLTSHR